MSAASHPFCGEPVPFGMADQMIDGGDTARADPQARPPQLTGQQRRGRRAQRGTVARDPRRRRW